MKLEIIILTEKTQTQKDKYLTFLVIRGSSCQVFRSVYLTWRLVKHRKFKKELLVEMGKKYGKGRRTVKH